MRNILKNFLIGLHPRRKTVESLQHSLLCKAPISVWTTLKCAAGNHGTWSWSAAVCCRLCGNWQQEGTSLWLVIVWENGRLLRNTAVRHSMHKNIPPPFTQNQISLAADTALWCVWLCRYCVMVYVTVQILRYGVVTVQILRYGMCDCADIALWCVWLCSYCVMVGETVQILRYGVCDCADTALWGSDCADTALW